jgi:hypothetical protein
MDGLRRFFGNPACKLRRARDSQSEIILTVHHNTH